jgi:hypothetical protein
MKTNFKLLTILFAYWIVIQPAFSNGFHKVNNHYEQLLGGACVLPSNPTITGNNLICANGSTVFVASAADTNTGTTYTWTGPNNFSANTASTGAIIDEGVYTCVISNGIGCSVSVSATLSINSLDFVNLQFPGTANICAGGFFTAFGQVFESGLTEAAGAGTGIVAELGISNVNSNPATWTNWTPASFNVQFFNNDEYQATIGSNLAVGTYYYTFRYSFNGCNTYQYGGFGAAGNLAFWNGTSYVSGVLNVNALPIPAITGNLQFCSNASTVLNAGSFSSYNWSNGANTQTITVNNPGNYSVTVGNSNGCTALANVNISTIPAPVPTITGNTGLCNGASISLSTQSFSSYSWNNSATSQSISVSNPGNYSVTVTAANNCTATTNTNVIINAVDYANLQFPGTASICSGSNFTAYGQVFKGGLTETAGPGAGLTVEIGFSPEGSNSNPSTWTNWIPATFNVQFFNNDEFVATTGSTLAPGTYYYTFRYSLNACSSYQYGGFGPAIGSGFWNGTSYVSGVLEVLPAPMPVITGNLAFCPGASTILSVGNFTTYNWSNGANSQTITVNNPGNYSVVVTHPINSCTATATVNTTLLPIPSPSITGDLAFCAGTSSLLDAGSFNSYSWSTGATSQTITINTAGTYAVSVTDANNCVGTSSVTTNINTLPNVGVIANPSATICAGSPVSLSGTGAISYTWSGGISNGLVFSPTSNGAYTVTGTDFKGCSNTATVNIVINNCSGVPLTQLIVSDCGKINVPLNGALSCAPVSGATNYDFEITNTSNNTVAVKTTSGNALALSTLTPALQFSTTYSIRVRAKVGGVYGLYGQPCNITTICNPAICNIPQTKLRNSDCGRLNLSLTSSVIADIVSGANQYEFEFRNSVNNIIVATRLQSSNVLALNNVTPSLQWATQYNVGVRAYIAGNSGSYGTICLIGFTADPNIAGVPSTKLTTSNCGKLDLALTSTIACDPVTNANSYQWEIKDAPGTSILATIITSSNSLNLSTVSALQWGTQYNVRVRATIAGVQGSYGVSCFIGIINNPALAGVPSTKLRNSDCGKLNFGLTGFAVADAVSGANQYEFEISNAVNTVVLTNIVQSSNTFNFSTSALFQWSTNYSVRVKARIGSTWGNFGNSCQIGFLCNPSLCGTPATKLRNTDCGKLNFLLSSGYMVAEAVSGATIYEFEIKNLTTNNIITQQRTSTTIFFNSIVPSLQSNTQYSVRVRATLAGVTSNYGVACTIGFVNGSRESEIDLEEEKTDVYSKGDYTVTAFPNPFTSQLNLSISNNNDAMLLQYIVYDVAGRLVEQRTINVNVGDNLIELDFNELNVGLYHLVMSSAEGDVKSLRLIKQ